MRALPTWAQAPEPRALIAAIIEERPDAGNPRDPSWGHRTLTYHGNYAPKLRRYFQNLLDEACKLDNAAWQAGEKADRFASLYSQEKPDQLIERLLTAQTDAVEELPDGRFRVAA
jgi:hypothetical protein